MIFQTLRSTSTFRTPGEKPVIRVLAGRFKSHGRSRIDDRRVLGRFIAFTRNGGRWSGAQMDYGSANTPCNGWKRWSDIGVFARIMAGLAARSVGHTTITPAATVLLWP